MKIIRSIESVLLAFIMCANFTACNDDIPNSHDLVGKWGLIGLKGSTFDNNGFNGTWEEIYDDAHIHEYLIFNSDGTGKYETKPNFNQIFYKWSLNNDTLKWNYTPNTNDFTRILHLDPKSLVLEINMYNGNEITLQKVNTYKKIK